MRRARWMMVGLAALITTGCGIDEEIYNRDIQALKDQVAAVEAEREELRSAKEQCLANYGALADEKGLMANNLQDALRQVEELQAIAAKRQAMLDGIKASLQAMVSAGTISVIQRDGQLIVAIAEAILFESGKSKLKEEGELALAELAPKLAAVNRDFQVTGHTDDKGDEELNWRLSLDRARNVLFTLVESGYPSKRMSAAGYAFFKPVAANDTDEGRQLNRRVEIVLVPDLKELGLMQSAAELPGCERLLAAARD